MRVAAVSAVVTSLLVLTIPATSMPASVRTLPPHRATFRDAGARSPSSWNRRGEAHARTRFTAPGCTTTPTGNFVSSGTIESAAGGTNGMYSGVLAGGTNEACDSDDAIGGGVSNKIGGDSTSFDSFIGAGTSNSIDNAQDSMIGSGESNLISNSPGYPTLFGSAILSGLTNSITASNSTVAGGYNNSIAPAARATPSDEEGLGGFIGGGERNVEGSNYASIVGGASNSVGSSVAGAGDYGFIGGGSTNTMTGEFGVIGGGARNASSASYATVEGGFGNTASGTYAMVPGGDGNLASGTLSFAAGYRANATHNGTFAWSDYVSGSSALKDIVANQFLVRASGGTTFYSNEAMTSGVRLAAGSGTWSNLSDRNAKTAIVPMNDAAILASIAALPVSTWSYASERGVRHAGPMAQDFYRAFGVGEDDRHITSIDEDGVALAAIKALAASSRAKDTALAAQRSELAAQRRELASERAMLLALGIRVRHLEANGR